MSQRPSGRTLPLVLLVAAIVAAGIVAVRFFAQSTLRVTPASQALALEEMDAVRQRFGPGPPCLERPVGLESLAPLAPVAPIQSVHMLAWSPEDRLVRAETPYWALRAGAWKIRFVRPAVPILEHVSLADVQRCGRGVLLDRSTAGGGRILIWVE